MPGAERLLVDPELLRQTEGSQVNQSLLSFATTLRKLAQGNQAQTIDQNGSVLTKLLAGMLLVLFLPCVTEDHICPCHAESQTQRSSF